MGFSLGEIVLIVLVGIIVVGPKRLPGLMRTAGQWVARLRRMSTDLRSQSGIDDLLRQEGLEQHLQELRSLSRINMVERLMAPAAPAPLDSPAPRADSPLRLRNGQPRPAPSPTPAPLREREYPLTGCDAYGALPDDAPVYPPLTGPVAAEAPAPDVVPVTPEVAPKVATETPASAAPAADVPADASLTVEVEP